MEVLNGLAFEFVFLKDLGIEDSDFVEDGETFKDNAFKKASYYAAKTGMMSLGEDSGVILEALPGELGVKSRRWGAGENASDKEWMDYFMNRMDREENRAAYFVCNACLVFDNQRHHFERETRGVITKDLQGPLKDGLPLSAVFLPDGLDKVYSALSADEKALISHRGKSLSEVKNFLEGFSAN